MDISPHPLKAWRKSLAEPLSQVDLAEKLEVLPSHISQIEKRTKGCSLELALKIRDLAGDPVPLESLTRASEVA